MTAVLASAAVTSVVDAPAPQRQQLAFGRRSAADGDVIVQRMDATRKWVASPGARGYSIQLFVAEDEEQLKNCLKSLVKLIDVNDLYLYRSSGKRPQMVSVLWGNFADRKAAQRELAGLPPALRANRPYVRTVGGLRAELKRLDDPLQR